MKAQDDVYDPPKPREVKVKQTYTAPAEIEKTVPYSEDESSGSGKKPSSTNNNNQNNTQYDNSDAYSNDYDYSSDFGYGYSDRIRRFHNSSIQFSYGYDPYNSYNSFYDPYNTFNDYGWNNYAFTPSWMYSYSNFCNPFWGCSQIIIIHDPWMSSWYNTGYYNPYNTWNYYSPSCAAIIYNNTYPYYGSYYDAGRKNVIYAPRTGGYYNNTNKSASGKNYNYNYPSNTNNPGLNSNTPNGSTNKKWNNVNNGNSNTNPDVYKYNNSNNNSGNWNDSHKGTDPNPVPSDNKGWQKNNNNNSDGGIKIGTRPK